LHQELLKNNKNVLTSKPMQLEKKDATASKIDAAKSKNTSANAFPPRHGLAYLCCALSNETPT
jgi:hypothetical protein